MTSDDAEAVPDASVTYGGGVSFEDGSSVSRRQGGQKVIDAGPNATPGESTADRMVDSVQIRFRDE